MQNSNKGYILSSMHGDQIIKMGKIKVIDILFS